MAAPRASTSPFLLVAPRPQCQGTCLRPVFPARTSTFSWRVGGDKAKLGHNARVWGVPPRAPDCLRGCGDVTHGHFGSDPTVQAPCPTMCQRGFRPPGPAEGRTPCSRCPGPVHPKDPKAKPEVRGPEAAWASCACTITRFPSPPRVSQSQGKGRPGPAVRGRVLLGQRSHPG